MRVAVILRAKEAGLSLETIRSLAVTGPEARRDILRREAGALRARIAAAQSSLELIECALDCDHEDFARCPRFRQVLAGLIGTHLPAHFPVRHNDQGEAAARLPHRLSAGTATPAINGLSMTSDSPRGRARGWHRHGRAEEWSRAPAAGNGQ
ncbi:MerR family DNA-binding protein [Streptomyces sp. NPDC053499]|uniref:MerR family DNA-binding protein n=1 Tax=Streptomyces sp. NPDC053499 TaxID=3365707 RepID=UPI0037D901BB